MTCSGPGRPVTCKAPRVSLLLVVVALASAGPARAQDAPPPRLLSPEELAAARPLTERGVVALVEPSSAGTRANLLLLGRVGAEPDMVYQVVGQPDLYPEFMAGMTSAEVSSRRQNTLVYGWEWRTSHMAWRGVSAMALAPPRDIAVRIMHSDLGTGQFRWHFYPADDGTCLAAESVTMDLSTGHRVIRWLASRGSAMSASVTLTLAIVLLEGSRERAVARAGGQAPSAPAGSATTMTPGEIARLAPLLDRGAVVMLENGPDRSFRQAIVIEAVDAPRQRVVDLLHHPERWPEAVPVLSALEVTGRDGSAMDARLVMNLSIFEVEGTVRFTPDENGVELRGTGGGLADLRLRFEALQLPDGRTVIQGTGRAHAARASFFLRQLVRVNPNFERGLNSSAQLLFVRGLAAAVREASGSR